MITETNVITGIRTEREYTAQELADIEASKIIAPPTAAEISAAAIRSLAALDLKSIRSMREWMVLQPSAPQILKNYETQAAVERAKIAP